MANETFQSDFKGKEIDQSVLDTQTTLPNRINILNTEIEKIKANKADKNSIPRQLSELGFSSYDYEVRLVRSTGDAVASTYRLYQGNNMIGTIDIPKDTMVSSGAVETFDEENLPQGISAPGTYIVLTLANDSADKLYINATDLLRLDEIDNLKDNISLLISDVDELKIADNVANPISLYNEVDITPSPEEWFVFDKLNGAITGLNLQKQGEISNATELIIPWKIGNVEVKTIGNTQNKPLYNDVTSTQNKPIYNDVNSVVANIKTIRLPNSITEIYAYAFAGFSSLQSVNIPTSLVRLGAYAFYNCVQLHEVITPVKPNWELEIGNSAFHGCTSLNNVDSIIDGANIIREYTFGGCGIKNVVIPESVDKVKNNAFNAGQLNMCTVMNPNCKIDDNAFGIMNSSVKYIRGYKGSTAEAYATDRQCVFISFEGVEKASTNEVYTKREIVELFTPLTATSVTGSRDINIDDSAGEHKANVKIYGVEDGVGDYDTRRKVYNINALLSSTNFAASQIATLSTPLYKVNNYADVLDTKTQMVKRNIYVKTISYEWLSGNANSYASGNNPTVIDQTCMIAVSGAKWCQDIIQIENILSNYGMNVYDVNANQTNVFHWRVSYNGSQNVSYIWFIPAKDHSVAEYFTSLDTTDDMVIHIPLHETSATWEEVSANKLDLIEGANSITIETAKVPSRVEIEYHQNINAAFSKLWDKINQVE